jgi:hypothetical protein
MKRNPYRRQFGSDWFTISSISNTYRRSRGNAGALHQVIDQSWKRVKADDIGRIGHKVRQKERLEPLRMLVIDGYSPVRVIEICGIHENAPWCVINKKPASSSVS